MQLTAAFMYIDLVLRNVASFLYFCDSIDRFCAFVSNSVTDNYITQWKLQPFLLFYGLTNPISRDNAVLTIRETLTTELEMIRKEEVMRWFEVLSRNLSGGTGEITQNLSTDSRGPGRDLSIFQTEVYSITTWDNLLGATVQKL
jgi:hypothetical protein